MAMLDEAFEVTVARLDLDPQDLRRAANLLSDEELNRAERFVFDRDRHRFIAARAELRQQLGKRTGLSPELIEIRFGQHGKPMLANNLLDADLRFNMSHSEDLAVFAFSNEGEIGIDVEAVRAMSDYEDIAEQCFSIREREAFRLLGKHEKLEGFFGCWTRKEAFIKAIGDGLSRSLGSFDVSLRPARQGDFENVGSISYEQSEWKLFSFIPAPTFVAAVAVQVNMQRAYYAEPSVSTNSRQVTA